MLISARYWPDYNFLPPQLPYDCWQSCQNQILIIIQFQLTIKAQNNSTFAMRYIVVYKESVSYNVSSASVSHRLCPSVRRKSLCTVYCVLCTGFLRSLNGPTWVVRVRGKQNLFTKLISPTSVVISCVTGSNIWLVIRGGGWWSVAASRKFV